MGNATRPADERLRLAVGAVFVCHAVLSATWAARIPAIADRLHLDHARLGLALVSLAGGTFLGTRGGALGARLAHRLAIRMGLGAMCAALVGVSLAPQLATLSACLFTFGLVGGFTDVVMNGQAVGVERLLARPIMSGLHGLWSLGLFVGSIAAGTAAGAGLDPRLHFAIVAVAVMLIGALVTRTLPADRPQPATAEQGRRRRLRLDRPLALLGVIVFCSMLSEGAAADWSAVYVDHNLRSSASVAAGAFAAFSLAMAASRLIGDRLVQRLGPARLVRIAGAVALAGMTLVIAPANVVAAIVGFALTGAGVAPTLPIILSAVAARDPEASALLVSETMTVAYLATVLGPVAIGLSADEVGLRTALGIPAVLLLVVIALAPSLPGRAA